MVELLPLKDEEDLKYVYSLLVEFKEKTDSVIAAELIQNWPAGTEKFVKVSIASLSRIAFNSILFSLCSLLIDVIGVPI